MLDLSATDKRLLAALTQDARASVTTLSHQLGLSRATVQSSLNKLVGSGTIQRFTIDIDRAAGVDVVRAVQTIEVQGIYTASVVKTLTKMVEVVSVHSTNGSWDLVAHIEAASLIDFDRLLREIREIQGILNTETNILLNVAQ